MTELTISRLTSRGVKYELMVELWAQDGEYAVAHYDDFWLEKNTTGTGTKLGFLLNYVCHTEN